MMNSFAGMSIAGAAEKSVHVGCKVRASRDDNGSKVDAEISASGAVSGTYRFEIRQSGKAAKLVSESGDFHAEPDSPFTLSKSGLQTSPDGGVTASLSAEWPNGSASCSASG